MSITALKEIKIKLPSDLVESISNKEITLMLLDKVLNKAEYFLTKCRKFEEKYGTTFSSFKGKVEKSDKEIFSEWDDLIVWEGYQLGYMEWEKKYKELKNCIKQ